MIEVYLDCPSPTASGPIVSECGTSKNVLWPTPGLQTTYFFVQNINRQLIGLTFSGITNAGSNVDVDIVYTRDGVTITAATLNLGVITSDTTKYHFLDFGTNVPPTGIFYLKFNISGGSSGDIDVFLDCNVPVGSRDFCFADFKSAPRNLCNTCPSVVKIYFPRNTSGFGSQLNLFSYSTWYTDPNLSTIASNGYYTPVNSSLPKTIYSWTGAPPATIAHLCDPREVPCGSALTQSHAVSTDYTKNNPYIPGATNITLSGLKYSTKEYFITFPSNEWGSVELVVSNTQTYQKEVVFTISDANAPTGTAGVISYSETPANSAEFFRLVTPQTLFNVPKNSSKTITLILNAQTNSPTNTLRVRVSVGLAKRYKNNSSPNILTTVSASCLNTLYSANTGLHAYSAWDAANSPKCTTTLFSFTNPVSWGLNSRVWHDPSFGNPALPYFYSYGSQVFKVGQPYRREFGVKINYELKTNLIRTLGSWLGLSQNPVTVTPKILGPKDWQTLTQVPACIEPTMKDIGLVKYIYNVGSLPEPTKYLYLVGKNNSDKIAANDSVFSQYDYTTSTHKPITGLIHCLIKIATGSYVRASNDPQVRLLINTPQAALAAFGLGLLASIISIAPSVFGLAASTAVMSSGTIAATGVVTVNGQVWCGVVGGTLSTGGTIIVVALIALALYLLFRNRKKILEEPCKLFDKVYTNNDYLENGNTIYSNTGLTVNGITGFYTDGGYFYTTTNGLISSKEVSYTNMNGARTYSIAPDNPPYITGIQNFFLLPYVSGRPYEWTTGVYLNSPISTSAVSTAKVGNLNTPSTIDYEIPEGLFEASTQVEADNLAQEYLSGLTAQTIGTYLSAEQLPTASGITTIFTHEIKLENTEAVWPVFFDNEDNLGLSVGKILYYDNNGIFSVLDGYYSISGNSGNFRTFYKTSGGTIIDYYDMTTSGATIVTSPTSGTLPVETTGQTYTSSWYFQGAALENVMYDNSNNINGFNETWNTSTFYSNEYVKRGMIDTPVSKSSLLTYVNNTTSYAFEVAPEGWYREIPNIFNENPFLIQSATTIYLDTIQNCSEDEYNGIYVTCVDESGNTMPSFYGVEGVLSVSTSSGVTTHDYVIENDDYRVLVPLGLEYINAITAATVTVTSTNPISGITFTDGTFYPCAVATPTPTPVVSPDVTPTPTVTPTKTPTQTPDCFCYEYLFTANDDTTASWTDCNSGAQSQFVSSGETIIVCVYPNSDIVGDGYTGTTGNVCGNPCITATPTPTVTPTIAVSQTPTPTPTPSSTPSNCLCYSILNEDSNTGTYGYTPCGQPFSGGIQILAGENIRVCSETTPVNESLAALTITACITQTTCNADVDCTLCS